MTTVTTSRHINVDAMGFAAVMRADDRTGTFVVEADVDEATLLDAVTSAPLDRSETVDARRTAITSRARLAVARLHQIEAQALSRGSAGNLAEVNQQLAGLANALADVSRMVRYIIVRDVVPELLSDDAASGDLDGTD